MDESRARIGVIYPSDGVMDGDFWRCVPSGVSVHVTRSQITAGMDPALGAVEQLDAMVESNEIYEAASTFSLIEPDCVAYACTSVSFGRGVGYDTEIIDRIRAASGSPATTTSTAAVAALRELGVRRVAVAAPYRDEVCQKLRRFLEDSGFEIVNLRNLGLSGMDIGAVPSEQVYELGEQADTPEAQALFISCTSFRAVDVLERLEKRLAKPVVAANQATMWHALRIAGIHPQMEGVGRLYRLPKSTTASRIERD